MVVADVTGTVSATFGTGAHTKLKGGVMTLTPTDNGGSISWACGVGSEATGGAAGDLLPLLPSSCQ